MEIDKSKLIKKEDVRVGDIIYYPAFYNAIILVEEIKEKRTKENSYISKVISVDTSFKAGNIISTKQSFSFTYNNEENDLYLLYRDKDKNESIKNL